MTGDESLLSEGQVRGRIKRRSEDLAVSLWYTYNQHFKAANGYSYLGTTISISTAALGGVLTYGLIWQNIPNRVMVLLAILIAVIQGVRAAVKPSHRALDLRQSAHQYKMLYEDVQDFLSLEVDRRAKTVDDLADRYARLNEKRQKLNMDTSDVSSLWYYYVKWFIGADGLSQTKASETERQMLRRQS